MKPLPANEVLRATPPPDEVGSSTAGRFLWQAQMAAMDFLALYQQHLDDAGQLVHFDDVAIICEHFEDWAIVKDDQIEIVSAKHRETGSGAISSVRKLASDGGIHHLFCSWNHLGRMPRCRLVTTMDPVRDAKKLAQATTMLRGEIPQDQSIIDTSAERLQAALRAEGSEHDETDRPTILKFMRALEIDSARPLRQYVDDMAGRRFGEPVAEALQRPGSGDMVWEATMTLVLPRMTAQGKVPGGRLPKVLGESLSPRQKELEIGLAELDELIRERLSIFDDLLTTFASAKLGAILRMATKDNLSTVRSIRGRESQSTRVFVSSRLDGSMAEERQTARDTINSYEAHEAWAWEDFGTSNDKHMELCVAAAGRSDLLFAIIGETVTEGVRAELEAARRAEVPDHIFVRCATQPTSSVSAFIAEKGAQAKAYNFQNAAELRSQMTSVLTKLGATERLHTRRSAP